VATSAYGLSFARERAVNAYRQSRVETASPGELVLMLYDQALKDMRESAAFIEQKDIARSSERLLHAQAIVDELRSSLDFSAGELSSKLRAMYDFIYGKLVEANVRKTAPPVLDAEKVMTEIRAGWEEALRRHG